MRNQNITCWFEECLYLKAAKGYQVHRACSSVSKTYTFAVLSFGIEVGHMNCSGPKMGKMIKKHINYLNENLFDMHFVFMNGFPFIIACLHE